MDNQYTLLIVDDEPFNLDILQENLEDEDYIVVRAEDGIEALRILEENTVTFSAVLLDRMMPHMDGLEVLEKIKASEIHKNLPVIIQTAAASDQDVMDGIKAGAFYYLTKPFEPELMLTIVKSAIRDRENLQVTEDTQNTEDKIFHMIKDVTLEFRTINEGLSVAGRVSSLFPDPDKVLLGLTELVINAVEHGNLSITYEEKSELLVNNTWAEEIERRSNDDKYKGRVATLEINRSESEIALTVTDQGGGFDWKKFIDMSTERVYDSHGRGIAMASMISFDELSYQGNGNTVRCIVKK